MITKNTAKLKNLSRNYSTYSVSRKFSLITRLNFTQKLHMLHFEKKKNATAFAARTST